MGLFLSQKAHLKIRSRQACNCIELFLRLKEHGQKTADRASGIRDKRINEQLCGFGKAGMEGVMKLAASLQDVPL